VQPLSAAMAEYEREYIDRTLKLAAGERKSAASLLGISRKSLWQKMVRYRIR
jgi:transcriptional regulator with PAS, ATPase and Fis domain